MGGSKDIVKLQEEELNIGEIIDNITSPDCGAISNFIGITRDNFENKKVLKLEYEAYEPMALKEMNNICQKIRSQWRVRHIAIYHRLGEVPVSKASVVIAISAPHRRESLEAVDYAITALKASVPIWKKEVYEREEAQWKENKECTWSNNYIGICEVKKEVGISSLTTENVLDDINTQEDEELRKTIIDSNLVQIRASPEELTHRIESFIERKRQQVNMVNVQEFCCHRVQSEETTDSCARVDAMLVRRKDSKSHVKVHRVMNTWGPQMMDQSVLLKTTMCKTNYVSNDYSSVLDDRISTTERILGTYKPVPRDIYERLKNIEDRILYLEGISPEYKSFWQAQVGDDIESLKGTFKPARKRTYSTAELDTKLHELADRYAKKPK
ncbi:hypothetical protein KM043_000617 [Ampulex compressa]|nr:hypothetical protein KM043_000617 [Ampulex compressa]